MKLLMLASLVLSSLLISARAETVPEGFVLQVLEPVGGKVFRPKEWFYSESHDGPSNVSILSKENTKKGPYITGVRIQTLIGVEKGSGKSSREFVLDVLNKRKKRADRVYEESKPLDRGVFSGVSFHTDEGPDHILYSFFWSKNLDMAVLFAAGTRKEEWNRYSAVFEKMSRFELVDMERFK